jgi:cytochrome c biogenesis protein CcdA
MRTIRRLYFYLVTFISLEVVIWGAIRLARSAFHTSPDQSQTDLLARGLSLVLAGLPIFLLHWVIVEREAARDIEEQNTKLRGVFLYSIQIATLIPVVQNIIALVSRATISLFGADPLNAIFGANQTWQDNILAVVINLLVSLNFFSILRRNWRAVFEESPLPVIRRLYRYVWVVYGLILVAGGCQLIFNFIFLLPGGLNNAPLDRLGNGVAVLLAGIPLWFFIWNLIQRSLGSEDENRSILRLAVLYFLSLLGALIGLIAFGAVLAEGLSWALGDPHQVGGFFTAQSYNLGLAIPTLVIWIYFNKILQQFIHGELDELLAMGMRNLYRYILAFGGNIVVYGGLWQLLGSFMELLTGKWAIYRFIAAPLGAGLAGLLIGLPLWLVPWNSIQKEALPLSDLGDHVRRSRIRRAFLYLALFTSVVGSMISAGTALYYLAQSWLGGFPENFGIELVHKAITFVLFLIWLMYYLQVVRKDGNMAQKTLSQRHAIFPVIIFQVGQDSAFSDELKHELQHEAPRLPVLVHHIDTQSMEIVKDSKAAILPADVVLNPPDVFRRWLDEYNGERIIVPLPVKGWTWAGVQQKNLRKMSQKTAQSILHLAEGMKIENNK